MPSARPDTRFTYEDFLLFPDDGKRHEIIDGEHYVTPSPNMRHQVLLGRLHLALGGFVAIRPDLGRAFFLRSTSCSVSSMSSRPTSCLSPPTSWTS
jgi:hypothetical protein